jgi:hypothetical protein
MSNRHLFRLAAASAALFIATSLSAAEPAASSPKSKPGAAASGKKLPDKVAFREAPSIEKPADRARRLKRECKGRPNAGMCLGYAS